MRVFSDEASFEHLSDLVLKVSIGDVCLHFGRPFGLPAAFLGFCFFGSGEHVCETNNIIRNG